MCDFCHTPLTMEHIHLTLLCCSNHAVIKRQFDCLLEDIFSTVSCHVIVNFKKELSLYRKLVYCIHMMMSGSLLIGEYILSASQNLSMERLQSVVGQTQCTLQPPAIPQALLDAALKSKRLPYVLKLHRLKHGITSVQSHNHGKTNFADAVHVGGIVVRDIGVMLNCCCLYCTCSLNFRLKSEM